MGPFGMPTYGDLAEVGKGPKPPLIDVPPSAIEGDPPNKKKKHCTRQGDTLSYKGSTLNYPAKLSKNRGYLQ